MRSEIGNEPTPHRGKVPTDTLSHAQKIFDGPTSVSGGVAAMTEVDHYGTTSGPVSHRQRWVAGAMPGGVRGRG